MAHFHKPLSFFAPGDILTAIVPVRARRFCQLSPGPNQQPFFYGAETDLQPGAVLIFVEELELTGVAKVRYRDEEWFLQTSSLKTL